MLNCLLMSKTCLFMYIYYLFVTKISYRFLYILYTNQNSYNNNYKHYKLPRILHCNLLHNLSTSQFYFNLLICHLPIIKILHKYSYIITHTQQNKYNNKHYKLHRSLIFYLFRTTHMSLNLALSYTCLLLIIITLPKMLRNAAYTHLHTHKYKHKLHTTHKLHLSLYYNSMQKHHTLVKNTLSIIELILMHTHVDPMYIICLSTTIFQYVLTLNYYHFKIR